MRLLIPIAFFLLAGWFLVDPLPADPPLPSPVRFDPALIAGGPLRSRILGTPTTDVAGLDLKCSDCHKLFQSEAATPDSLLQHTDIVMQHGMNDRCFNCHSPEERNLLELRDGTRVPFEEVQRLCAECHGTLYRDWQAGSHGRTSGSWDPASGEQRRLVCTDCHDPHAPAFPGLAPLPGPNTLRMGERKSQADHHPASNPLRRQASKH